MRNHNRVGRRIASIGITLAVLGLPATGAAGSIPSASAASMAPSAPHVMTIMMENTDYSQFAGSAAMPYLNELAHQYADFTEAFGWHYPSLPNYLELLSGSTEGVSNDCDITQAHCHGFTHEQSVQQLEAAGYSWHAYYQGDPSGCYQGDGSGNYPYWHNSFRYFADFSEQCSHISNFGPLLTDLSSANSPDYAWVVPDLVNSGGDNGTMSSGDTWLAGELPKIMATSWYREGGQIVILYDTGYEDSGGIGGASGGQIPMVVVSAHTRGMGLIARPVNTAGVLRSVEDAYGLPHLGDAANPANGGLGGALVAGRPVGPAAAPLFHGAVVETTSTPTVRSVPGTLALSGVYRYPDGSTVAVGEDGTGEGVVVSPGAGTVVVPGTSMLESVSCATSSRCYAVGLATSRLDEAVVVTIVNGQAVRVDPVPSFIGLYGVACPTSTTCYAVGYDNASDADSVTTIVKGSPSAPAEVPGGGEWLNAISCPTSDQCYAAGLVNYSPAIVPISAGTPSAALTISKAWYVNSISCPFAGTCVAVGENASEQGVVATMSGGTVSPARVVPHTGYLYGVGCVGSGSCVLTGAGSIGVSNYPRGVVATYDNGVGEPARAVEGTSGFGQVACGVRLSDCVTVGSAIAR